MSRRQTLISRKYANFSQITDYPHAMGLNHEWSKLYFKNINKAEQVMRNNKIVKKLINYEAMQTLGHLASSVRHLI